MKNILALITISACLSFAACNSGNETQTPNAAAATPPVAGQSGVKDATSSPNIVQVASGSKDHTTLVAAVVAADLVDALSNAGPFTVFAPTNEAFAKLPAGTVETLLKPENKEKLQNILGYHTYVGVLKTEYMNDGQSFGQVFGGNIKISKKDGKIMINGKATIIASIPTSNGIIHVIDEVLLPE
ncbi:MAG: fasciclin domain-containing protein [Bacteroidetes bacterium]|nr:fasciclin domain-containing protein [Bacteroidota bacterium]